MNATVIQATINNADSPIIQHLFEKPEIKTTILETVTVDDREKSVPVEKSIPNEETHKTSMEMREDRHSMKGYIDIDLMIKGISEGDE